MNLRELNKKREIELIFELSQDAHNIGVGKITAGAVAVNFDSLEDFLNAGDAELKAIVTVKGKRVLSDDQVAGIIAAKNKIPRGMGVREAWIFKLADDFVYSQVKMVKSINLDDLDINPILVEALDLKEPHDILSFVLYQTVTRSVVTAWGSCVEKMVMYAGCEENDLKNKKMKGTNFDLKKCLNGKDYYIQIKSGPNTMNVGMVQSLNKAFSKLEHGDRKGLLGMTYGTRSRISQQIMGNLNDGANHTKIGRELWDFISEERDYYKKVLGTVSKATSRVLREDFIELIDKRIDELEKQWDTKFKGKTRTEILEHYI